MTRTAKTMINSSENIIELYRRLVVIKNEIV